MKQLPDYGKIGFDDFDGMKFEEIVPEACSDAIDLLKKFLVYPSKHRIGAQQVIDQSFFCFFFFSILCKFQALLHYYFYTSPLPCHHTDLPIPARRKNRHVYEFDVKRNILDNVIDHEMILSTHRH